MVTFQYGKAQKTSVKTANSKNEKKKKSQLTQTPFQKHRLGDSAT